jgi:hypothetical protein
MLFINLPDFTSLAQGARMAVKKGLERVKVCFENVVNREGFLCQGWWLNSLPLSVEQGASLTSSCSPTLCPDIHM